jgi:NADPH:quinone reductase
MHAIRLHEFGPAENLRYEEIPDPEPGPGEVRVRVEAAGVHLLDTSLRSGDTGGAPIALPELPTTPGREVGGTVDAIGPDTDESWLGRRVVAHLGAGPGGYAELALVSATALFPIADPLDAAAAVALVGTGRTTAGVLEAAALRPDDVVLIPSAAGGMGSLFIQSAKQLGATVIGLAGGADKVELVRSLGADAAIDYLTSDWPEQVRKALDGRELTIVLDGVGGDVGRAALDLLAPGGRLVMFGFTAGTPTRVTTDDIVRGITVGWPLSQFRGRIPELAAYALQEGAAGRWLPLITRFPLAKAADAHRALADRTTVGKVVLIP